MNRQNLLERNVWIYRITTWLGKNGFTLSIIYFFLVQIKDQSAVEALFLIGMATLAKSMSEIPTGVIADKFSRKSSLQIGFLTMAIAWILLLFVQGFTLLFLTIVIRGMGASFVSGADDSLLYDSLKELKKTSEFKNKVNISKVYDLVIFAGVVALSGLLATISLYLPVIISVICTLIASVICLLFVEPDKSDTGEKIEEANYLTHTWESIKLIFSSKGLFTGVTVIFLASALIDAALSSNKNILAPIFENYGISVSLVGSISSIIYLAKAFGAYVASRFNKEGGESKEIGISLIIYIVGLSVILFSKNVIMTVIIFSLIGSLDPFIRSNFLKLLNDRIPSNKRSTILSFLSVVAESAETLFLILFGWLLQIYSLNTAIIMTIVWIGVVGIIMFLLYFNVNSNYNNYKTKSGNSNI